jgi:hypothetical protein
VGLLQLGVVGSFENRRSGIGTRVALVALNQPSASVVAQLEQIDD